jgi:hypothetical protein
MIVEPQYAHPTLLIVVVDHPPRRDQRCWLIAYHELVHPLISPSHSAMIPDHRSNRTAGV